MPVWGAVAQLKVCSQTSESGCCVIEQDTETGIKQKDKYRLLHGVFDPSPDLSPSRLYQPEPEGRGLILSEG